MKATVLLVVLWTMSTVDVGAYTTRYDSIDVDQVMANERLRSKYIHCLLQDSDSTCTAEGKELKEALPDALTNECSSCTDKQKEGAQRVIEYLKEHLPDDWKALEAKFDPTGAYAKRYESRVDEEKHES